MAEITTGEIKDFLLKIQGQTITLRDLRAEFNILPGTVSFDAVRNIMFHLAEQKLVRAGRRGEYKVVTQVTPVSVFSKPLERKPPFDITFPRDFNTGEEFGFAQDLIIRAGDVVLISGLSNFGKTALAMNFLTENIEQAPVLMGNEYTTLDGKPTPRFINRLDTFDGIVWLDEEGQDRFVLLPVHDDYAEHVVNGKINIIDWINIESGEHYLIGSVINGIKRNNGDGVSVIAIQKAEGTDAGRGGQFTKDFADVELLIDRFGEFETLLTIGKVKEYRRRVVGRSWAYGIQDGVHLVDVREMIKCPSCFGKGYTRSGQCVNCRGNKFLPKNSSCIA